MPSSHPGRRNARRTPAPTSAPTATPARGPTGVVDPRPARPEPAARAVAALLLLSAVAYTAWVLEVVLSTGLDPVQAYISELAAEDQPLGGLFRATDLVAGLAVLAAALLALSAFHLRRPAPAAALRQPGPAALGGGRLGRARPVRRRHRRRLPAAAELRAHQRRDVRRPRDHAASSPPPTPRTP